MKQRMGSRQKSRLQVRTAALVLLAVALVIPQFAWADHAGGHEDEEFYLTGEMSASEFYAGLVEKYATGELVYHAPGRRDDTSFSASASEFYAGLLEKYATGELVYHAPGRRDDTSFSASGSLGRAAEASSARWVALGRYYDDPGAAFYAANPEVRVFGRFAATRQQEIAAAANSARWTALGAYYAKADFLAANPELGTFWRFAAQNDCPALEAAC